MRALWIRLLLRTLLGSFFLLTSAYALLNCSPFAFDMFIRPQLFPWLNVFVAWHHVLFAGAWALSLAVLAPELRWRPKRSASEALAHRLALGYVIVLGVLSARLLNEPFLPTLWNDSRALPTALAALVPLMWLAVIDHLAPAPVPKPPSAYRPVSQYRLLVASGSTAGYLWVVHVVRAPAYGDQGGGVIAGALSGLWTLTLCAAVFSVVYLVLCFIAAVALRVRSPGCERTLTVGVLALCTGEFLRRVVFPTVSIAPSDAMAVSLLAGGTVAATWSGLACRRLAVQPHGALGPLEILFAQGRHKGWPPVALLALPALSGLALNTIERLDWNFVGQRTLVFVEFAVAFGLMLRVTGGLANRPLSTTAAMLPPVLPLALLLVLPATASMLAAKRGDPTLDPAVAFDRGAGAELAFSMLADVLVQRPGFDAGYYRFLQAQGSGRSFPTIPDVDFRTSLLPVVNRPARGPLPDIYVFVIDSLRRDYLSPYNPSVSFTPQIDAFAAGNFVFRNAFTRHGATELSIPSIWAGATMVRKARGQAFYRMNALEKLVNADRYRIAINDFTVAEHLRPTTPVETIDPGVPSVRTDLCQNLESLRGHQDGSAGDGRPLFAFLAPMNVHILNTRRGGQTSLDGDYSGFYAPYASRVKRLDACFGEFLSYLRGSGRYDNSIIVLTSDHGDSLGEDGYWGHATWLFPESVRVPLIIKLPEALRPAVTTDLARVAFSTDLAPTLYALLGHEVRSPGPLLGESLFVPSGSTLPDRRRDSFLLTSSYGAAFGLVRDNGRSLYISDLVEWREFAYALPAGPAGRPVPIAPELRRQNQRRIREQVSDLAALYQEPQ